MKEIQEKIRAARIEKGYIHSEMARRLKINMDSYFKKESDKYNRVFTVEELIMLELILDIKIFV